MFLRLIIWSAAFVLGGCTSGGFLSNATPPPTDTESFYVLGISPDYYRVSIFPGEVKNGRFRMSDFRPASSFGTPVNGFLTGKANAGDMLAITYVYIEPHKGAINPPAYQPCGNATTLVFEAPRGKVVYLGSITYSYDGGFVQRKHYDDFPGAQRYVDENFPHLKGRLERLSTQMLPTTNACNK